VSRMFSIDLAREVDHISRRQHLNAVQDLVLLVRRALRAGAHEVRISRRRNSVTIVHDGCSVTDDERTLLGTVLGSATDDEKHAALGRLEREHGIALLALLVAKDDVTVRSRASLRGGRGCIATTGEVDSTRTTITYTRPSSLARAEKRELAFYARHADVPIFLDGKALERHPAVGLLEPRAILGARLSFTDDEVLCTLVDKSRPTRIRYLDHGIFFGVRARSPTEAVPIDVVVNTRSTTFDENYRGTIERSHAQVERAEREALDLLARHPGPLDDERRRSVRAIVIGLKAERAREALLDLPLYDTVGGALLSTRELTRVVAHRHMLLYVRPSDVQRRPSDRGWRRLFRVRGPDRPTGEHARIPILDDREAQSLAMVLHVEARRSPPSVAPVASTSLPVPPALDDTPPALGDLVADLCARSPTRFRVIAGGETVIDDGLRECVVGLAVTDPVVIRAAAFARERPDLLAVVEARLIGHARETAQRRAREHRS
jgi:hypothetical protein